MCSRWPRAWHRTLSRLERQETPDEARRPSKGSLSQRRCGPSSNTENYKAARNTAPHAHAEAGELEAAFDLGNPNAVRLTNGTVPCACPDSEAGTASVTRTSRVLYGSWPGP